MDLLRLRLLDALAGAGSTPRPALARPELQPGDILLVCSPNPVIAAVRALLHIQFDHVTVALSDKQALDISLTKIRRVPLGHFLSRQQGATVLRPTFTEEARSAFLADLAGCERQDYDVVSFLDLAKNSLLAKLYSRRLLQSDDEKVEFLNRNFKCRNICSDLIAFKLAMHSQAFLDEVFLRLGDLKFAQALHFHPDDFATLAQNQAVLAVVYRERRDSPRLDQLLWNVWSSRALWRGVEMAFKTVFSRRFLALLLVLQSIQQSRGREEGQLQVLSGLLEAGLNFEEGNVIAGLKCLLALRRRRTEKTVSDGMK